MPDWVVFCDIIGLSYFVSDPINLMSVALDFFCIPLTVMFAALLSVATSVVGCWWPIYARAVLVDVAFWQFSNNPPNSASSADAITLFIMIHYT